MPTREFQFQSLDGHKLSGRLEMPDTEPKAFALFAHCFTCSKNAAAASRISKEMAKRGFATLRFDFTGLGNSEGDFANTNFSSNVSDLLSAAEALKKEFESPKIIIGHSLGGAAVLSAASDTDAEVVITIGAPSDTKHVSHLFQCSIPEIEEKGSAKVQLAGRDFEIKKQFLEDIQNSEVLKKVREFRKALLLFHSPQDDTVSIDHAAEIYKAAKHPKSFVSLDRADHLLNRKEDAEYVADVICAWCSRYIV